MLQLRCAGVNCSNTAIALPRSRPCCAGVNCRYSNKRNLPNPEAKAKAEKESPARNLSTAYIRSKFDGYQNKEKQRISLIHRPHLGTALAALWPRFGCDWPRFGCNWPRSGRALAAVWLRLAAIWPRSGRALPTLCLDSGLPLTCTLTMFWLPPGVPRPPSGCTLSTL